MTHKSVLSISCVSAATFLLWLHPGDHTTGCGCTTVCAMTPHSSPIYYSQTLTSAKKLKNDFSFASLFLKMLMTVLLISKTFKIVKIQNAQRVYSENSSPTHAPSLPVLDSAPQKQPLFTGFCPPSSKHIEAYMHICVHEYIRNIFHIAHNINYATIHIKVKKMKVQYIPI